MTRTQFLAALSALPAGGTLLNRQAFESLTKALPSTEPMPVLFIGHGSPMNAINDNPYVQGWKRTAKQLPRPAAILVVSAHWETRGTQVTAMEKPRTIHDFGGFPQALFDVQYPAPGSPDVAKQVQEVLKPVAVQADHAWGLDHGAWSVVMPMFPKGDIPVLQLSLDYGITPAQHYELARKLGQLRRKGVLIVGSGNMVHNLRLLNWREPQARLDWAITANEKLKGLIKNGDHKALANYTTLGREVQMAIPTAEHYLPLIYALALQEKDDELTFFNDGTDMGAVSMTSVMISKN